MPVFLLSVKPKALANPVYREREKREKKRERKERERERETVETGRGGL